MSTALAPRPPSWRHVIAEVRVGWEFLDSLVRDPITAQLPRGQGQTVLVIPGYGTSDTHTLLLRRRLTRLGYRAVPWGLGRNHGNLGKLLPQLLAVADAHATPMLVLGWSLGGVLARMLARERPQAVQGVLTLGTPVVGGPKYTIVAGSYRKQGLDLDAYEHEVAAHESTPLLCPVTALYSDNDGIVGWRACLDPWHPQVRHQWVAGSHCGMPVSRNYVQAVAHALAQF